tara:strand:- start:249 stop:1589 length:1341 start_codon:yes stop_codon:yes gene_type:complete
MRIGVFGTGYVGLVTACCFADVGNKVLCYDVDKEKIDILKKGEAPIYEKNLEEILKNNLSSGRIDFLNEPNTIIEKSDILFIAVGTPEKPDGSADLTYVLQVAKLIGKSIENYKVVVNKSTVPVGTAELVNNQILKELEKREKKIEFDVISNPEFLKEGNAVEDFKRPDRIIIGTDSKRAAEVMEDLYEPFSIRTDNKIMIMKPKSAELTKYAANSMLATKISFINEISQISELAGADIEEIRLGLGSDSRIGYEFIYPGVGFGGSCFPKDLASLVSQAKNFEFEPHLLNATIKRNELQKLTLGKKIQKRFKRLSGKKFCIWGLSFKPETDDIREAPSIDLVSFLLDSGAEISAYDPMAMENFEKQFPNNNKITFSRSSEEALHESDALIILTEWKEFKNPDFTSIARKMKKPIIFDGRNTYSLQKIKKLEIPSLEYHSIGRDSVL